MTTLPIAGSPRPSWLLVPAALFVALLAGRAGATGSPFISAILIVLFAAVGFYAFLGVRLRGVFLGLLIVVLAGYAFFGRGFAYVGVAPLFIGEMTLAVGLGALFANGLRARPGGLHLILLAFIGWGLVTTVPYLGSAGIDALRDAAFWGYSVFALVVWALVTNRGQLETAVRVYRVLVPVFVFAVPVIWLVNNNPAIPSFPGAPVPILVMKGGDIAVHLAGAAAFVALGLYRGRGQAPRIPELAIWAVWGVGLLIIILTNRGGFLAAAMVIAALVVLRPSTKMIPLAVAGLALVAVIFAIQPSVTVNGREFSAEQVTGRTASIVDSNGQRRETVDWRLDWWGKIIGYTVRGEYFWTGKGFGANLADEDGFLGQATGLRSPHNATMTALARMGVPGLGIWLAFHIGFGIAMFNGYLRAQRRGDRYWAAIILWLLLYWGAGIVNGSFDVYWEGPQGAIWMWTVIGLGLAVLEIQKRQVIEDSDGRARRAFVRVAE